jgi:hypothetical protein
MKPLMVALLTWIGAHSGYSVPDAVPDVIAMTQTDFKLYLCEQVEQCDSPMPHIEILALFAFENLTVYVLEGFDPRNVEQQSTMVRMLVHFLQAHAGRAGICRGILVQEARQIESQWRVSHGLPPLPITPIGMLLESCGPGPT